MIPPNVAELLRAAIGEAGGNEVLFYARVAWSEDDRQATVQEVEVAARGDRAAVPAILEQSADWDLAIHNHPSGPLTPSEADLVVAHELGNRSVGFAIIDNDAASTYVVVPPFRRERRRPVDLREIERIFANDGPIAAALDAYESRQAQVDMALEVARVLNEGGVVACEAGTGVGKSFAYLVPAILWAVQNRERVVVSTGTINLQEQLVGKDLPFLERVLPVRFRYALAKGRNNYACKRKIAELPEDLAAAPASPDERAALEEITRWSSSTGDGSLADLAARPPHEVWDRVMSETDKSLKVNCKFYQECFYYQAKRQANRAQILVANHHLFFADLALRRASGNYKYDLVLPGYGRVVFDEAHHIEDVASEHLSLRFSRGGVAQRLARMCSHDGRRGRLPAIAQKLQSHGDESSGRAIVERFAAPVPEIAERIDENFHEIQTRVECELAAGTLGAGRAVEGADAEPGVKVRWRPIPAQFPFWDFVRLRLGAVRADLDRLSELNDHALGIVGRSRANDALKASLRLELESFRNRLELLVGSIETFSDYADSTQVRWIDPQEGSGRQRRTLGFAAVPVRVADLLDSALYRPLETVVLTSATLSVGGSSDFVGERLGFSALPPERFRFHTYPSPFDYARQVLTVVPRDMASPGTAAFADQLPGRVLEILRATRGRAFVLFTSYSLLQRTHAALEEPLRELGIRPLAQGQAGRSELLRRFRDGPSSVLFGTDSFWEGVDVKGRALECVIITRLPFRVPTDPLYEARAEDVEARGKSAFACFTVPQAVLRFKQGFDRLIRSAQDRGVVAILDQRILTRPYGKTFLASLPETRLLAADSPTILSEVEAFFADSSDRSAEVA